VFDSNKQIWIVIDVELVSAEWMFQFSIENEGKGQRTKEETTEIGMVVTSGTGTSNSVSASAGFSGWGFSAEVNSSTETKTFSSLETSQKRTVRDTYTCPPEPSIFDTRGSTHSVVALGFTPRAKTPGMNLPTASCNHRLSMRSLQTKSSSARPRCLRMER
jgi:hypothetical protein